MSKRKKQMSESGIRKIFEKDELLRFSDSNFKIIKKIKSELGIYPDNEKDWGDNNRCPNLYFDYGEEPLLRVRLMQKFVTINANAEYLSESFVEKYGKKYVKANKARKNKYTRQDTYKLPVTEIKDSEDERLKILLEEYRKALHIPRKEDSLKRNS